MAEIANDSVSVQETESQEVQTQETEIQNAGSNHGTEDQGAETQAVKPKRQSRNENARMASLRRTAEGYQEGLMRLARQSGLTATDADNALEQLEAKARNMSVQELRRSLQNEQAEQEERVRTSALYRDLEERAARNARDAELWRAAQEMQADLRAIQEVDKSITSLEQLGDAYKELVEAGVTGLNAYYVIKGRAVVEKEAAPPATGTVGSGGRGEDALFTGEELDRLSPQDLDQPGVLEKAIRSMHRLGRR